MTDRATNADAPRRASGWSAPDSPRTSAWQTPERTTPPRPRAESDEEVVRDRTPEQQAADAQDNADALAAERRAAEWRSPAQAAQPRVNWRDNARVSEAIAEAPGAQGGAGSWFRPAGGVTPTPASTETAPAVEEAVLPHDHDTLTETPPESASETADDALTVLPFDDADVSGALAAQDSAAQDSAAQETAEDGLEQLGELADEVVGDVVSQVEPQPPAAEDVIEDDDESYSMSELIALASLVEQSEGLGAGAPEIQAQAEPASADDDSDPASYARRELERLQREQEAAGGGSPAIESAAPAPTAGADAVVEAAEDPAAVARRELERLQQEAGGTGSQAAAAAPALAEAAPVLQDARAEAAAMRTALPQLSAAEAALAGKYLQTVEGVLALRDRQRTGELDDAAFQQQARALLVNDGSAWWMFGPSRDQWFRYDSASSQWIEETPAEIARLRSLVQGSASGSAAAVDLNRTMPTAAITDDAIAAAPLPRAVPVSDPDYTVVGTSALYLDQDGNPSGEQTVPVSALTGVTVAGATVPAASFGENTVPSSAFGGMTIPSAVPADVAAAPDYGAASAASPTFEDARLRQQRKTVSSIAIAAAVLIGAIFLIGACGIIAAVLQYRSIGDPYTPQVAALANYQPSFQTARILAADGSLIAELVGQNSGARTTVSLSDISPYFIHAVISVENERYYDDPGFDPVAIGRAFLQNLSAGEIQSGASTITQQVARTLVLRDSTVSAQRKLQEIVVASEIAQQYDKNFILELYLNESFFGNQSYGVEAAAQFYFGHSAADLNLAESAMLAGLLQAPATYDPVINRQAAFDRMNVVLRLMADVGCLQLQNAPYQGQPFCVTASDIGSPGTAVQKALIEAEDFEPRSFTVRYPHFVNFIQAQLEQNFGTAEIFQRGFTVRTTLVPRIQDSAQQALEQGIAGQAANGIDTGAVMVMDPRDGAIRAMIGSPDFNDDQIDGQVNNVFTWQQPGSSIKPVTYTAALEGVDRNGIRQYMTPATILWDVPTTFQTIPAYTPVNFDGSYRGPTTVRAALAQSLNVPAVKVYDFVGADAFRDTSARMGLRFLEDAQFGLATALGATEVRLYDHMQVYATLANNGVRALPYAITEITDSAGAAVALPGRPQPSQVVQPQIAYLMQNILSDNDARTPQFGANSGLILPEYPGLVGAKTGTTNDNRDLWTLGFSRNMVVGVWMGRHDNQPTRSSTQQSAVPVWNAIMRAALQGTRPDGFQAPGGVVQAQICADTGTLYEPSVQPNCPTVRTEIFVQNEPPPPASQGFVQTVQINSWTGLRANANCPENVITGQVVNISDAAAVAWLNGAGAATAQRLGITTPVSSNPVGECTPGIALPTARITSPTEGQQVLGTVSITGVVTAPSNFNRYQIEIAQAAAPDTFTLLVGPYGQQVANGALASWNTTQVANGNYRLRVAGFASDGGYIYSTPVSVVVNNPLPTATPVPPTAIPTTPPLIFPTSNPFQPTPIPFLEPTPTVFLGA